PGGAKSGHQMGPGRAGGITFLPDGFITTIVVAPRHIRTREESTVSSSLIPHAWPQPDWGESQ
ncbi:MAG: hypothetical protein KJZ84_25410, partial [Bryobacteraceae bacterium]|nr:hypothetical protein [Bryobacteraceae bacterium]